MKARSKSYSEVVLLGLTGILLIALAACVASGGTVKQDVVTPYVEVRPTPTASAGSGTVVRVKGELLVLTACHVVESALPKKGPVGGVKDVYLYAQRPGGDLLVKATPIYWSLTEEQGGHDLALLRPRDTGWCVPAVLGLGEDLEEGEDVWYCGSGSGIYGNLDRSIVARPKYRRAGNTYLLVNGGGWYGHSGSGVFVKRGDQHRLVGVVVRLAASDSPKSPVVCQTEQTVRDFLDSYTRANK